MDESWVAEYPEFERHHFWWRARRDIIERLVDQHAHGRSLRVLDVGCGTGLMIERLAARHEVEGIEPDGRAVTASPMELNIRQMSVESAGYADGSFDVVLMLDVLEHLDEPQQALGAARHWVAPSGLLIVTVPAFRWLWTVHDERSEHRRRYRRGEIRRELETSGWRPTLVRYLFASLVPPKAVQVIFERTGLRPTASHAVMPGPLANSVAYRVLRWDARVSMSGLGRWWLGTSLIAIGRNIQPNMRSSRT